MESNLSASSSNHVIVSVQYDCFVSLNEIHQFSVLSLKMFVFAWALMSRSRHLNWAGNPPISWLRRLLNCQQTPPIRHTKGGNGSDPVSRSNVQNLAAFSSEVADRNQLNNPFLTFSYNRGLKKSRRERTSPESVFILSVVDYIIINISVFLLPFLPIDLTKSHTLDLEPQ